MKVEPAWREATCKRAKIFAISFGLTSKSSTSFVMRAVQAFNVALCGGRLPARDSA